MEIWKPVIGFEGFYEVSDMGRVRSVDRVIERKGKGKAKFTQQIIKPFESNGYLMVTLRKNGVKKNCKVHRLVAEAFIPNADNLPCINHRDANRKNNEKTNLEWCSYLYNNQYRRIRCEAHSTSTSIADSQRQTKRDCHHWN